MVVMSPFLPSWINDELREHKLELWIDGAKQYIDHAQKLLQEVREAETSAAEEQTGRTLAPLASNLPAT